MTSGSRSTTTPATAPGAQMAATLTNCNTTAWQTSPAASGRGPQHQQGPVLGLGADTMSMFTDCAAELHVQFGRLGCVPVRL